MLIAVGCLGIVAYSAYQFWSSDREAIVMEQRVEQAIANSGITMHAITAATRYDFLHPDEEPTLDRLFPTIDGLNLTSFGLGPDESSSTFIYSGDSQAIGHCFFGRIDDSGTVTVNRERC
jgi:hypothetical protein